MKILKLVLFGVFFSSISISAFSTPQVLSASGIGIDEAIQAVEKKANKDGKKIIKIIGASGENVTRVSALVE